MLAQGTVGHTFPRGAALSLSWGGSEAAGQRAVPVRVRSVCGVVHCQLRWIWGPRR